MIWKRGSDGGWARSVLPGAGSQSGGVNAIIGTGDGLIAVGWRADQGTRWGAAWRSSDGQAWTASTVDASDTPLAGSAGDQGAQELRAVAPLPAGGYIALEAAAGPWTLPLFSADGRVWSAMDIDVGPGGDPPFLRGEAATLARFDAHVYAVGTGATGALVLSRSTDGRVWAGFDVPTISSVEIHAARVVEGRLLMLGSTAAGPLSLSMTEGGVFEVQPVDTSPGLAGPATFYDVAGSAGWMVAVGTRGADAALWASGE